MGTSRWLNVVEADSPQRDAEQESGEAPDLPVAPGNAAEVDDPQRDIDQESGDAPHLREELAYIVHGEHDNRKEVVRLGMGSPPGRNLSEAVQPGMGSRPLQNPSEAAQPGMGSQLTQNRFSGD